MANVVNVNYDEFCEMVQTVKVTESVKKLLVTEFPDAECQLKAIKVLLDIDDEEVTDNPTEDEPGEEEVTDEPTP